LNSDRKDAGIPIKKLVRDLRAAVQESLTSLQLYEAHGDGEWQPLPNIPVGDKVPVLRSLEEIALSLKVALDRVGFTIKREHILPQHQFWSFGNIDVAAPIRRICRGFIEPVRRFPIISTVPDIVVSYLMEIPGERDLLQREHHAQTGWHYHYLDSTRARSNVVLCWDTRAVLSSARPHPLFQETHGEGHARFTARPDCWGNKKKRSMHGVCAPDLQRWKLSEFRCASSKAGPVWPLGATLTPVPSATVSAKRLAKNNKQNASIRL